MAGLNYGQPYVSQPLFSICSYVFFFQIYAEIAPEVLLLCASVGIGLRFVQLINLLKVPS